MIDPAVIREAYEERIRLLNQAIKTVPPSMSTILQEEVRQLEEELMVLGQRSKL